MPYAKTKTKSSRTQWFRFFMWIPMIDHRLSKKFYLHIGLANKHMSSKFLPLSILYKCEPTNWCHSNLAKLKGMIVDTLSLKKSLMPFLKLRYPSKSKNTSIIRKKRRDIPQHMGDDDIVLLDTRKTTT